MQYITVTRQTTKNRKEGIIMATCLVLSIYGLLALGVGFIVYRTCEWVQFAMNKKEQHKEN